MKETLLPATEREVSPEWAFVNALKALEQRAEKGDSSARGRLARLRRALRRQGVGYEALREIGEALPENLGNMHLDVYLLVAALFAHHPNNGGGKSMGESLHALRNKMSTGAESLDRRFATLLSSDSEDLPYRLRQLIQMLASKDIPVNYHALTRHLLAWNAEKRWVQRTWARAFWTS